MGLLTKHDGSGVPFPYLLARIAGRRACLVADWLQVLTAPEPLASLPPSPYRLDPEGGAEARLTSGLQHEFAWIHHQMGRSLQAIFEPFFLPLELRTLFTALRLRSRGDDGRTLAGVLRFSLLSSPVKRLLMEGADLPAILAGVGANVEFWPSAGRVLPGILQQQGLAGCEERLMDACLGHAARNCPHPAVATFVTRFIDMENITALIKQLRWKMVGHGFIDGGSLPLALLREAALDLEGGAARRLMGRVAGGEVDLASAGVVPLMATRLGRVLRRQGREPDGVGLILDYLWRRLTETRNLSLILYGTDVDRDTLEKEMVV